MQKESESKHTATPSFSGANGVAHVKMNNADVWRRNPDVQRALPQAGPESWAQLRKKI